MARLNAQTRQEQIIELLNNNGSMKATELQKKLYPLFLSMVLSILILVVQP